MKFYIFILSICLAYGCSDRPKSREDVIRKNTETILFEKMDDPSSYEFVSLKAIDSVTVADNIDEIINSTRNAIDRHTNQLRLEEDWKKNFPNLYSEKKEQMHRGLLERRISRLSELEARRSSLTDSLNVVTSYIYEFSFRANNRLGAKVLQVVGVQVDDSLNVFNIALTPDELVDPPNKF